MKLFQGFNGLNPTQGTTFSQAFACNYIINNSTNAAFITALLANNGIRNSGFTALVVSLGNHDIWATTATVPTSGLPPGTTPFSRLFFDANELISSGNLAFP
jgi:hypothetical protein